MGQLFLINESFEMANIPEQNRDKFFGNFGKVVDRVKIAQDNFRATADLYTKQFSFGDIFFFLDSWANIIAHPSMRGVTSTTLDLYQNSLMDAPLLAGQINSKEAFDALDGHKGYSGLQFASDLSPYIHCDISWMKWKIEWFTTHQDQIQWTIQTDPFLPNLDYSNQILLLEINRHGKGDKLAKYKNNIALTFHEEVMRHKGDGIEGYTDEIGSKIAKANFYLLDTQLSADERRLAGNSLRKIFKLRSRGGLMQYISLDFRHGMFEFHDNRGKHLGEKKFDGSFNSKAETSHDLKSIT